MYISNFVICGKFKNAASGCRRDATFVEIERSILSAVSIPLLIRL